MADETKSNKVTLEELHIGNEPTPCQANDRQGVIPDAEFATKHPPSEILGRAEVLALSPTLGR